MNNSKLSTKSAGTGLLAAIIASLCCITPVFSFLAGIGSIASTFSWMEPLRPYMIALTLGILGFAWYQKLRPRSAVEIACACEEDTKPSFWQSKKFLGIATIFSGLLLAFPSYSHIFYSDFSVNKNELVIEKAMFEFEIEGMTCTGCEEHVTHVVGELTGIEEVKASYEQENAIVKYNTQKIDKDQIVKAINKAGYEVIDIKQRNNGKY